MVFLQHDILGLKYFQFYDAIKTKSQLIERYLHWHLHFNETISFNGIQQNMNILFSILNTNRLLFYDTKIGHSFDYREMNLAFVR